ncbi:MAG: hypothetical protein IJJ41_00545 [Clostridia bacterium]|nr:hypothetical protein [Clostridia bacterium]
MMKKVLPVLFIAILVLFAFTACKSTEEKSSSAQAKSGVSQNSEEDAAKAKEGEKAGGKTSAADKKNNNAADSSEAGKDAGESKQTTAAGGKEGSGKQTTTAKGDSAQQKTTAAKDNTDGWKKQKDGSYVKGKVSADVVRYGSADVDEGEELIKQLAKGGLEGEKKLSSEKGDSTVTYCYSGKRAGHDNTEFIKFEFIVEKGTGYLVTVIAEKEADMGTDIGYLTSHLAAVAK